MTEEEYCGRKMTFEFYCDSRHPCGECHKKLLQQKRQKVLKEVKKIIRERRNKYGMPTRFQSILIDIEFDIEEQLGVKG